MHHVAIMSKKGKLLDRILDGTKTIESRWYVSRRAPWNRIRAGDTVYFKNSGEFVTAKVKVKQVLQFQDLTPSLIKKIIKEYGHKITDGDLGTFLKSVQHKRYCVLLVLQDPQKIRPFAINKKGFGMASAWLTVRNINGIRQ